MASTVTVTHAEVAHELASHKKKQKTLDDEVHGVDGSQACGTAPEHAKLRKYDENTPAHVREHYEAMHKHQTLEYARAAAARMDPGRSDARSMTIMEALDSYYFIDKADPDFDANNVLHCYQTAEACRRLFPDKDYMHLVGLIHDLGKSPLQLGGIEDWSNGGDTFVLGAAFSDLCVYHEAFAANPDSTHPVYSTQLGIYTAGCGFDALTFSFGHDEYMYQVLRRHPECRIPDDGLYCVRFHSFYPWHQQGAYAHFASDKDRAMLAHLRAFQTTDLYSKVEDLPEPAVLRPYYEGLVKKYCPGVLRW